MRRIATPTPLPALTITRHDGPFEALAPLWETLDDPHHPGAPFRTFPWVSAWWRRASTSRKAEVLLARRGDAVVGLLPLYREDTALGGIRHRLMGDERVGSDYLGALAPAEERDAVGRAFAAQLAQTRADEVRLDDLLPDDPLATALPLAVARPRDLRCTVRYLCPRVRLEGSFERYLRARPDGLETQYHRRLRWLERRPGFRFEILSSPAAIARGMEILLRLHRERWSLEGGSDGIVGEAIESFHRETSVRLAERGWSRIFLLHADGAPRAALYGWRVGSRFAYFQAGHEPAWRQRSVGTVLLGLILEHCFGEGLTEFDFLRGDEPYKTRWANDRRETVRLRLCGPGLRPRLLTGSADLYREARARLRESLPPAAVDWLRARRRTLLAWRRGPE
jgi:CelD/BcsL family acetyltransferase involved in cellulose biosynthesis